MKKFVVLLLVVCALNAGASEGSAQSKAESRCYASGTTSTGRHVNASGDITLGVEVLGDTVAVGLGEPQLDATRKMVVPPHTLTIESQKVLLDGKERAKISTTALVIDVRCTNKVLFVTADKKKVLTTKMDK